MKKIIKIQFFVLLIGAIFTWSNFVIELFDWLNYRSLAGTAEAAVNPFFTTCFYGALFFTLALILNLLLLIISSKRKTKPETPTSTPA